jgi:hypothetical protein
VTIDQLDDVALGFIGWQCRLRQHAVRRGDGRPSAGMFADVTLPDGRALGSIVTLIIKADPAAATAQFRHIANTTHDPVERYEAAIKMLQTVYYQYPREFSVQPTALFAADSAVAETLLAAQHCTAVFSQGQQRFSLACTTARCPPDDPVYAATFAHNVLFNPRLAGPATVVQFLPDWSTAVAELNG